MRQSNGQQSGVRPRSAIAEDIKENTQFQARCYFSVAFLATLFLFTKMDGGARVDSLSSGVCLVDLPFVWVEELNTYETHNLWLRDLLVIFSNLWFDVTMTGLLLLFWKDVFHSSANFLALGINSIAKTIVQEKFFALEQPAGFGWYFPGIYSFMVPFHDICDFYFSGHIATGIAWTTLLYKIHRRHPDCFVLKCAFYTWLCFKLPYTWVMMMVTHTHFSIDMFSAFALGICIVMFSEKLSYVIEVSICGLRAQDRDFMFYKACPGCGWANRSAADHIDIEEKLWQALAKDGSIDLQLAKGVGKRYFCSSPEFSSLSTKED